MDSIQHNEQAMYDAWHQRRGIGETANQVLQDPWYQTVMRLLPPIVENAGQVLEIGTGRGAFAHWMAQQYPHVHIIGTDFSAQAIALAKKNFTPALPNLVFETANAEALPYPEAQFDVVVSCETMEHVLHPQQMAKEIYRVLKPGGRFIITTENYCNGMLLAWFKTWITGKPFDSGSGIQPHENFFIFLMVARYLKKAGLKLTHTESNYYQWLLLPKVQPAALCTKEVKHPFLKKLCKPFGRHYTFMGIKPNIPSSIQHEI